MKYVWLGVTYATYKQNFVSKQLSQHGEQLRIEFQVFTTTSSQKQFHFRNPAILSKGSRYFAVCGQYAFDFSSRIHFAAVLLTLCAG